MTKNKKLKKKMNLLEIEAKDMLTVSRTLASEQRKKILNVVVNSEGSLTITEVQQKSQLPNYKNIHKNLKLLAENGFLSMEMRNKMKYIEGAKVTTDPGVVLKSIFEPIERDLKTVFLVFQDYWSQRPDLLNNWYLFLKQSKLDKKKIEDKK